MAIVNLLQFRVNFMHEKLLDSTTDILNEMVNESSCRFYNKIEKILDISKEEEKKMLSDLLVERSLMMMYYYKYKFSFKCL